MTDTVPQTPVDAPAAPPSNKRWYIVHAYSGMEKAVERNLRERIDRAGMQDKFGRILVPTEEVVELKNGKKAVTERRIYPGYVLVEMEMADESWHLVKHTSKVTGFIGGARNRPAPISEAEVAKIMSQMQEGVDQTLESHGIKIFVDMMSFQYLVGTEVDYVEGLQGAGFKFQNPNVKSTCGCGSSFSV